MKKNNIPITWILWETLKGYIGFECIKGGIGSILSGITLPFLSNQFTNIPSAFQDNIPQFFTYLNTPIGKIFFFLITAVFGLLLLFIGSFILGRVVQNVAVYADIYLHRNELLEEANPKLK